MSPKSSNSRESVIRASDRVDVAVYLVLVGALSITLYAIWPWGSDLLSARSGRVIVSAILSSTLVVALLLGTPWLICLRGKRRRLMTLAKLLQEVECVECGAFYDLEVTLMTGHEAVPLCLGDPQNEDLRSRWLVQCGECGAWQGYGDDGERIVGGMVPIPK